MCTVISTIDWLLGSKWQKTSRLKFEDYWVILVDSNINRFTEEILEKGHYLIDILAFKLRNGFVRTHKGKRSLFILFFCQGYYG